MNMLESKIKKNIKKCFNQAASCYDQCSQLQQQVGEKLIDLLSAAVVQLSCQSLATIIDVGCGTGLITQRLVENLALNHHHFDRFYAVDFAELALNQATSRLERYGIDTYNADFDHCYFDGLKFDLIFSNLALHWGGDIRRSLNHLLQQLSPQGVMAFSLPLQGSLADDQGQAFVCQSAVIDYLNDAGVSVWQTKKQHIRQQHHSMLSAYRSIKAVGANYNFFPKHRGLRGRKFFSQISQPQQITLDYHIGYFIVAGKN